VRPFRSCTWAREGVDEWDSRRSSLGRAELYEAQASNQAADVQVRDAPLRSAFHPTRVCATPRQPDLDRGNARRCQSEFRFALTSNKARRWTLQGNGSPRPRLRHPDLKRDLSDGNGISLSPIPTDFSCKALVSWTRCCGRRAGIGSNRFQGRSGCLRLPIRNWWHPT